MWEGADASTTPLFVSTLVFGIRLCPVVYHATSLPGGGFC